MTEKEITLKDIDKRLFESNRELSEIRKSLKALLYFNMKASESLKIIERKMIK